VETPTPSARSCPPPRESWSSGCTRDNRSEVAASRDRRCGPTSGPFGHLAQHRRDLGRRLEPGGDLGRSEHRPRALAARRWIACPRTAWNFPITVVAGTPNDGSVAVDCPTSRPSGADPGELQRRRLLRHHNVDTIAEGWFRTVDRCGGVGVGDGTLGTARPVEGVRRGGFRQVIRPSPSH
jgi:hypothetical protein